MMNSLILRVGGEAGWGIATASNLFCQLALKLGYKIFSSKDYASQIKGGHNYHTVRISSDNVGADLDHIDILLALDKTTFEKHESKVNADGIIVYSDQIEIENKKEGINYVPLNITEIQEQVGNKNVLNAIFFGAAIKCLGLSEENLEVTIKEYFQKKPELGEILLKAAKLTYQSVNEIADYRLEIIDKKENLTILSGNDAITKGALKAGLNFHAQYPMTPVSAILHNLAKEAATNENLTVIQPEDEIAAINMAIGASYAGSRAMTATSGGGFALMVESLGLAAMAEVPLVVIEGQRPGPATGLPTKTEQGDLKFVLNSGTGDFPHVVIAPGTVEECYTETKRAFYLAEKYQLPVIVLVDKNMAESFKTVNLEAEEEKFSFDYDKRINIVNEVQSSELNSDGLYKRYTPGNMNTTLPGTENGIYTCAGDEHDEVGEITEDPEIRKAMMERRMVKLKLVAKELSEQEPLKLIGPENADLTVVSWGSNYGAICEAIDKLNAKGKKVNFVNIKFMLPFQTEEVKEILKKSKKLVLIENNYSAQLGSLIREKTGIEISVKDRIL
ncbi:MAG: 2-oxoacid:acceptor oxidoreductase subunit alpha, partial [Nanoarchaeota archaeon]|nr:2-oxoacid:acceptor oxidoreductase subunit alpha [Nanoarchaeota archaeon]